MEKENREIAHEINLSIGPVKPSIDVAAAWHLFRQPRFTPPMIS